MSENLFKDMNFSPEQKKQIINNIISTLVRLDNESKEPNITATEFARRGEAIKRILNKIESDFGSDFFVYIFKETCKKLGHTLCPLHNTIIKKLTKFGFEFENESITRVDQV